MLCRLGVRRDLPTEGLSRVAVGMSQLNVCITGSAERNFMRFIFRNCQDQKGEVRKGNK